MKQFFLNLIDATNSKYSSKRFSGLIALTTIVGATITAMIQNKGICPEFIFNGILFYGGSCFGLNAMEKIFHKDAPIVDNNAQPVDERN